ncbi:MAG: DMT family transporter [Pseudomonadota bacterium]
MSTSTQTAAPTIWPFASLVAAMVFTGANVPIGKWVIIELPILAFLAFRFAVATAALAAISTADDRRAAWASVTREPVVIALLSLVGSVMFSLLMLEGSRRTSAVEAGIVASTLPAVVAAIAVVVLGQRLTRSAVVCILVTVAGLAVMQWPAGAVDSARGSLSGNAIVGAAVLCEAIFVVASRGIAGRLGAIPLSLAVSGAGLAFSLPVALVATDFGALASVSLGVWIAAVCYALAASVFCTILWYLGARAAPTWQAGLATASLPITAVAVSALFLGETISVQQLLGGGLVVAAIVAAALISRESRAS